MKYIFNYVTEVEELNKNGMVEYSIDFLEGMNTRSFLIHLSYMYLDAKYNNIKYNFFSQDDLIFELFLTEICLDDLHEIGEVLNMFIFNREVFFYMLNRLSHIKSYIWEIESDELKMYGEIILDDIDMDWRIGDIHGSDFYYDEILSWFGLEVDELEGGNPYEIIFNTGRGNNNFIDDLELRDGEIHDELLDTINLINKIFKKIGDEERMN